MDPSEIKSVCIESCTSAYNFFEAKQRAGENVSRAPVKVVRYDVKVGYVVLWLSSKLFSLDGIGFSIDGKAFFEPEAVFDMYDEEGPCITLYTSDKIMDLLMNSKKPKMELAVVTDLKFLVTAAKTYYELFGDLLNYPNTSPSFSESEYTFPVGIEPSEEQRKAVRTVLNSKMSYIWGAPGTGKTQFVLATAILANIRSGKKVLISAPTNNSVEQVLRGVMKIIQREDPKGKLVDITKDIVRVGIPSVEFARDFPDLCTQKGIDARVLVKQKNIKTISTVLFEMRCEILKAHFDEIDTLFNEEYDGAPHSGKRKVMSQIMKCFGEVKSIVSLNSELAPLVKGVDEYNLRSQYPRIAEHLFERLRPGTAYEHYTGMPPAEVEEKISQMRSEIEGLQRAITKARYDKAKIIACTPQKLMLFAGPPGAENLGSRYPLDVDHIFIDEVGYCNVVNTLPLFTFGKPITMLGDHMQLPPVCEIDRDAILLPAIKDQNAMRYAFLWALSALHAESMFFGSIKEVSDDYVNDSDPRYKEMKRADLTESHRFGDNLAKILDEHIYKNGIRGISADHIRIECVDAVCYEKKGRENTAEVDRIETYLKDNPDLNDFVILTPYNKQVSLLTRRFPKIKENVLTIHRSQGREWDTVILSVADNRVQNRDVHLRFTSTKDGSPGKKVMNTAISRAKKNLIVVCDCEFWSEQKGEMIGKIVREQR
jgi:hypothetical protein